jgi:P4 family phage/plasmid primase-like protien
MDSDPASPAATSTDLFRPCVEALWPNGEPALVLTYEGEAGATRAAVVDMRQVQNPAAGLWQFITWTVPTWVRDQVHAGQMVLPHVENDPTTAHAMRRKVQSGFALPTGQRATVETLVWNDFHPFVVLEIDYLLCEKGDPAEVKAVQRQAIAAALQESRFPYTVLIDSGGKSVHAVIRLADSVPVIMQAREPNGLHDRLQEALWVALGEFDRGVYDQGGKYKLVRAPGALRTGNIPQTILAVNPEPVTYQRLAQWAEAQMFPEVAADLASRPPIKNPALQPWRLRSGFKTALRTPWVKGGRGTQWWQVVKEMTTSGNIGLRGDGTASFLWWFASMATQHLSGGWFFSQTAEDQDPQKERRYTIADAQQFRREKEGWERQNGKPVEIKALGAASHQAQQSLAVIAPAPSSTPTKKRRERGDGEEGRQRTSDRHPEFIEAFLTQIHPNGTLKKRLSELGGDWMKFDGRYWKKYPEERVKGDVLRVLGPTATTKERGDLFMHISDIACLHLDEWPEATDGIVFKNGTLYFTAEDGETSDFCFLENHFDMTDYITTYINRNYSPTAKCPVFMDWLSTVQADPEVQMVLQEVTGVIFVPDNRFNVFILHCGDGGNGKSTYIRTVKNIIGKDNYAAINLGKLDDVFSLGYCQDKLLLYDDEVGRSSFKPGSNPGDTLKKISGNEPVEMQKKYGAVHTELMHGTVVLNCNQKPHWATSPDSGFWRRILIIPWDANLENKEIISFYKRFRLELDGILAWAMEGLKRLMERQGKSGDNLMKRGFTKAARLVQEVEDFQAESDPIKMFAQSYLMESQDKYSWWSLTGIWSAYKAYCAENDIHLLNTNYHHFARRLASMKALRPFMEINRPYANKQENRPLDMPLLIDPKARYNHSYRGFTCTHPAFKRPIVMAATPVVQGNTVCHNPPALRVVEGGSKA